MGDGQCDLSNGESDGWGVAGVLCVGSGCGMGYGYKQGGDAFMSKTGLRAHYSTFMQGYA